jgi:hypothetical protein
MKGLRHVAVLFLVVTASNLAQAQQVDTLWLSGIARESGNFGKVLAAGDLDGDGIDDLATTTPIALRTRTDNIIGYQFVFGGSAGLSGDSLLDRSGYYEIGEPDIHPAVLVTELYGAPGVLVADPSGYHYKAGGRSGSGGCPGPTDGGRYGMAAGDFDGDGEVETVLGCPLRGRLQVFSSTLEAFPNTDAIYGPAFDESRIGADIAGSLAAGDFNKDGFDDLAVGVPRATVNNLEDAGAVDVVFGSDTGLLFDSTSVRLTARREGARFGEALTVGDYNNDGFADLAVSAPRLSEIDIDEPGAVVVFNGSADFDSEVDIAITQNGLGEDFDAADGERLGTALATGDFDGDQIADLAIGVPFDMLDDQMLGSVGVVFGSPGGLELDSTQQLDCNTESFAINCSDQMRFGYGLAAGDFNEDGVDDLAVGIPGAPFGFSDNPDDILANLVEAGAVLVSFGGETGLAGGTRHMIYRSSIEAGSAYIRPIEDRDSLIVPMMANKSPAGYDLDAFGRRVRLDSFEQPEHGTLTYVDTLISYFDVDGDLVTNGLRGALLFSPEPDFFGSLSFRYVIKPDTALVTGSSIPDSASAVIRMGVQNVNDAPVFVTDPDSFVGEAIVGTPYEADIEYRDPDGDFMTVGVSVQPPWIAIQHIQAEDRIRVFGTPTFEDVESTGSLRLTLDDGKEKAIETYFVNVRLGAPLAPTSLEPVDGSEGIELPPTVSWASVPSAQSYRVQVATDSMFAYAASSRSEASQVVFDSAGVIDTTLAIPGLSTATRYFWRVQAANNVGVGPFSAPVSFVTTLGVASEKPGEIPAFGLAHNYPNPFGRSTTIEYSLEEAGHAELTVYDTFGRIVRSLVRAPRPAGRHRILFNASDLAVGVYFVRLKAGGREAIRRLTVMR